MDLRELQKKVNNAVIHAVECGVSPNDVDVSVQIDDMSGKSAFTTDLELHYDNDGQASGCVLVGVVSALQPDADPVAESGTSPKNLQLELIDVINKHIKLGLSKPDVACSVEHVAGNVKYS